MLKSVKISKKNYESLARMAGELQKQRGRPVSIDEAISWLQNKGKGDIMGFAGRWHGSREEMDAIFSRIFVERKKSRPRELGF